MKKEEHTEITAKAMIEILGKPQEHVNKIMTELVEQMKKEKKKFDLLSAQAYEAQEAQDKLFSSFVDLELKFKNLDLLMGFCFDYMPSSLDIVKPSNIDFDATTMNSFLNDLLSQIHKYDMVYKKLRAQNTILKHELDKLKGES